MCHLKLPINTGSSTILEIITNEENLTETTNEPVTGHDYNTENLKPDAEKETEKETEKLLRLINEVSSFCKENSALFINVLLK